MQPASAESDGQKNNSSAVDEDPFSDEEDDEEEDYSDIDIDAIEVDTSDLIDNSVLILPGVKRLSESIVCLRRSIRARLNQSQPQSLRFPTGNGASQPAQPRPTAMVHSSVLASSSLPS